MKWIYFKKTVFNAVKGFPEQRERERVRDKLVEFFTLYSVYRTNEPKRFDVSVSRRFYKRFSLECCSLCKNRRITFFPDNSPVHVRCFRHVKRVVSQRSYYKMFIGRTSHDEPSHSSQIVSARRVNCREIFLFFFILKFENFSLYSHGAHARGMNKYKNKFVEISLRYDAPNTRIKKKEKEKILSRNNFFAWPLTYDNFPKRTLSKISRL